MRCGRPPRRGRPLKHRSKAGAQRLRRTSRFRTYNRGFSKLDFSSFAFLFYRAAPEPDPGPGPGPGAGAGLFEAPPSRAGSPGPPVDLSPSPHADNVRPRVAAKIIADKRLFSRFIISSFAFGSHRYARWLITQWICQEEEQGRSTLCLPVASLDGRMDCARGPMPCRKQDKRFSRGEI
jgi:hypothetical protein